MEQHTPQNNDSDDWKIKINNDQATIGAGKKEDLLTSTKLL